MTLRVIGIDCATDHSRVGVAIGAWEPPALRVEEVETCTAERHAAAIATEWLDHHHPGLVAIDAPLGWPRPLGDALSQHEAGAPIRIDAHSLFRRQTDRFVQEKIGKTPLDVGADRIARTAHAALDMIDKLRAGLGADVPLAWDPDDLRQASAIEVYPAATLTAHGFRSSGYKKLEQVAARDEIIDQLRSCLSLQIDPSRMQRSADALDAVVCLLAAKDFLEGRAMPPDDPILSRREGWIWVAAPRDAPRLRASSSSRLPSQTDLPNPPQGDVITNTTGMAYRHIVGRAIRCPACQAKVFRVWPLGWDGHAAEACSGLESAGAESRKREFKSRFRHLFR